MTTGSQRAEARPSSLGEKRSFGAGAAPKDAGGWAATAVICFLFVVISTWLTFKQAYLHAVSLGVGEVASGSVLVLAVACAALLAWPAFNSMTRARRAREAVSAGDLMTARIETSKALDYAHYTVGFAALFAVALALVQFLMANDMAVSRTFLSLPLIGTSFPLVLKAFWINIYIFVVAEICVLVWGLIVAVRG